MPDSDGLARPIDFGATYGAGHRRAVVLGGGGVVFVAWLTAYLAELARRGVDVQQADLVVGTSAGAVLAWLVVRRESARQLQSLRASQRKRGN